MFLLLNLNTECNRTHVSKSSTICSFWLAVVFTSHENPHMNTSHIEMVESRMLTVSAPNKACRSLDVSFVSSCISNQCAHGGILEVQPLLGRFNTVFYPFDDNGSQCVLLKSQSLRNGLVTSSRLKYCYWSRPFSLLHIAGKILFKRSSDFKPGCV